MTFDSIKYFILLLKKSKYQKDQLTFIPPIKKTNFQPKI